MANDKAGNVVIEVTLDDGSTKKFFTNLEKQAAQASGAATEKVKEIDGALGDAKGLTAFTDKLTKVPPQLALAGAAALAAGALIKSAFDFALAGEQIKAIETTFDRIATSQGLAGLRDQLTASGGGLVDINSILNDTSSALLNLNDNAAQLPQLLNVAVDSARLFGGTAEDRFLALTRAVETGNTKILKQQGIIIDTDKVFGDYAATLGLLGSELTQAQRQQALLNEVLAVGATRAAAGGEGVAPLAESVKRLSVGLGDLSDDFKKYVNDSVGPFFTAIINGAADGVVALNKLDGVGDTVAKGLVASIGGLFFGPLIAQAGLAIDKLRKIPGESTATIEQSLNDAKNQISDLENQLATLAKPTLSDWSSALQAKQLREQIAGLKRELPDLEKKLDVFRSQKGSETSNEISSTPFGPSPAKIAKLTADQISAIQNRNAQILALDQVANQQFLITEQMRLDASAVNDQTLLERKVLFGQQLLALGQQRETELATIETTFAASKGFSEEQRQAARLSIIEKYNQLTLQKTIQNNALITAQQRKFAESTAAIIQAGLVNTTVAGLESLGRSLQKGALDFQDFGGAIANVIGDMAISLGRALIVQGLAVESFILAINSLLPGSGIAAAAAGAGLIIFGSALKASVGGGGSSSGGGGGFAAGSPGGVPISTMPVTDTPIEDTMPAEEERRGTEITVQINGDVLDSDETGLRIVELINEAFDKQGVVIKNRAVS